MSPRFFKLGLALAATLLCSLAAAASNTDEWHKTYDLTGTPELRLTTGDGNVEIEPGDSRSIQVDITTVNWKIGENVEIHQSQSGNLVTLDVPTHWGHGIHIDWNVHRRLTIHVRMPAQATLNVRTRDGDIGVRGIRGEIITQSGDGHQRLEDLDGRLTATSGDGQIDLTGRFDELHAHTGDGRIEATAKAGSKMASSWNFRTGDGSVRLRVPANLSADVEMHTGDGHIDFDAPLTVQGKLRGNDIQGKLNGGGEILTLRTGDGSIHLQAVTNFF